MSFVIVCQAFDHPVVQLAFEKESTMLCPWWLCELAVTLITPVWTFTGAVAVIDVALLTVNAVASTLLNFTEFTPVKFCPVIETWVPEVPVVGVKDVKIKLGKTNDTDVLFDDETPFTEKVIVATSESWELVNVNV